MKSKILVVVVSLIIFSGVLTSFQVWESASQDMEVVVENSKDKKLHEVTELIGYAIVNAEIENTKLKKRHAAGRGRSLVFIQGDSKEIEVDLTRAENEIRRAREKFEKLLSNSENAIYQVVYIYNTLKGVNGIHDSVSKKLPFEPEIAVAK